MKPPTHHVILPFFVRECLVEKEEDKCDKVIVFINSNMQKKKMKKKKHETQNLFN